MGMSSCGPTTGRRGHLGRVHGATGSSRRRGSLALRPKLVEKALETSSWYKPTFKVSGRGRKVGVLFIFELGLSEDQSFARQTPSTWSVPTEGTPLAPGLPARKTSALKYLVLREFVCCCSLTSTDRLGEPFNPVCWPLWCLFLFLALQTEIIWKRLQSFLHRWFPLCHFSLTSTQTTIICSLLPAVSHDG